MQSTEVRIPGWLSYELRELISLGPVAHLSTIGTDRAPQVSAVWLGLDGDELVTDHMSWYVKLQNMSRDPRVVLSFDAPRVLGIFLN
jgi:nitroimidazol reductase NimA-like FMN-containing flavoprotein (pyridoxamine 5'-phosphate oxidase superfamily)